MTKEIALSQQGKYKGLYVALVDDCDYERINAYRWCVMRAGNYRYAVRFIIVDRKKITILMHREVIEADDSLCVDHVDLDGLNNIAQAAGWVTWTRYATAVKRGVVSIATNPAASRANPLTRAGGKRGGRPKKSTAA